MPGTRPTPSSSIPASFAATRGWTRRNMLIASGLGIGGATLLGGCGGGDSSGAGASAEPGAVRVVVNEARGAGPTFQRN